MSGGWWQENFDPIFTPKVGKHVVVGLVATGKIKVGCVVGLAQIKQ